MIIIITLYSSVSCDDHALRVYYNNDGGILRLSYRAGKWLILLVKPNLTYGDCSGDLSYPRTCVFKSHFSSCSVPCYLFEK